MGPSVERILTICSNSSTPLNQMAAMPMYLNLLLQNQESFEAESLYIVLGMQGLPVCSDDDPKMAFDFL